MPPKSKAFSGSELDKNIMDKTIMKCISLNFYCSECGHEKNKKDKKPSMGNAYHIGSRKDRVLRRILQLVMYRV